MNIFQAPILIVLFILLILSCKEKVEPKVEEVKGFFTEKVKIADTLYLGKSEKIQFFLYVDCYVSYKRHVKKYGDSSVTFNIFMNKTSKLSDEVMCPHSYFTQILTDSFVPTNLGGYKIIVNDTNLIKTVIVK